MVESSAEQVAQLHIEQAKALIFQSSTIGLAHKHKPNVDKDEQVANDCLKLLGEAKELLDGIPEIANIKEHMLIDALDATIKHGEDVGACIEPLMKEQNEVLAKIQKKREQEEEKQRKIAEEIRVKEEEENYRTNLMIGGGLAIAVLGLVGYRMYKSNQ